MVEPEPTTLRSMTITDMRKAQNLVGCVDEVLAEYERNFLIDDGMRIGILDSVYNAYERGTNYERARLMETSVGQLADTFTNHEKRRIPVSEYHRRMELARKRVEIDQADQQQRLKEYEDSMNEEKARQKHEADLARRKEELLKLEMVLQEREARRIAEEAE